MRQFCLRFGLIAAISQLFATSASAHDTWVQTNTNLIRSGDAVHIDLMLGNHGNEHRDFKLASKVTLDGCSLRVIAPSGKRYDVKDRLTDTGYAEGRFLDVTIRRIRTGPVRRRALGRQIGQPRQAGSFAQECEDDVRGQQVARQSPAKQSRLRPCLRPRDGNRPRHEPGYPNGARAKLTVKLLLKGQPLANSQVSFIPRSESLTEDFDDRFERKTDANGFAHFTPKSGDYYLIVAHLKTDESGEGFEATSYSATLTVFVPEICPCCGE